MYQPGDVYSDIFECTDVARLDFEMRIFLFSGGASPTISTVIQTTSDPTFDSGSWKDAVTLNNATPYSGSFTGVASGLGRFVRAKLTIPASHCATVCVNGVGREP
jgi:hypothetical protein